MITSTMSIKIRHGILELVNYNKTSAIIINDDYILSSGLILSQFFTSLSINKDKDKILDEISNRQLIRVWDDSGCDELKIPKFTITFDKRKSTDKPCRVLTCYNAKLLFIFNSVEIRECFESILSKIQKENSFDVRLRTILNSSFLFLKVAKQGKLFETQNFNTFIKSMGIYSKMGNAFNKTDEVMSICSPFGIENFYKTIHFGKISNILGRNNCLFIISNNLPVGCEGSAIFNNRLRLIGILICTSLSNGEENINITLAANIQHIFKSLALQLNVKLEKLFYTRDECLPTWEKSLVIIQCNGQQGTGTFVKILNRKFILTCSHVILNNNFATVQCRYINGIFLSQIIWENPNIDEPFDVAILSVPEDISNNYFVSLSEDRPYLGQNIFNAGFPFFTNIQEDNFSPGIFEGRVIKYKPGCIIADATLQAGQSGGPMFTENGTILGICVSNLKLNKTVFPNVNTSVPICDIKKILEKFAKTNDASFLDKLVASSEIKKIWALETPMIDCKL